MGFPVYSLGSLLRRSSEKEMAVDEGSCLKIEKEIPGQLLNRGSVHGRGSMKRAFVVNDDVVDVFNRVSVRIDQIADFRDGDYLVKGFLKDFVKMMYM